MGTTCNEGGPNVCGVTRIPVADAYVRQGQATTNFGSDLSLQVKRQDNDTNNNRRTFVRFDISGLPAVGKATLRLFGNRPTGTNAVAAFQVTNTTWIETGPGSITWNNKPGTGSRIGNNNVTISTQLKYYDFDVTSWVVAQQGLGASLVSMAVMSQADNPDSPSSFQSREAPSNPPLLVITP